jgi:hypothetical protein
MMPPDVRSHLLVQCIKDFRTEELVHFVHARPDIIPETVRRHVPSAVVALSGTSHHLAIEEDVSFGCRRTPH